MFSMNKGKSLQFSEFGLDKKLLTAVEHLGFEQPTEIQARAIPSAMVGHDLIASSKTGSGKTLAFLLPALQRLLKNRPLAKRDPRVLILAPTRELAKQVFGQLKMLLSATRFKSALILGGENYNDQVKVLQKEPEFIVATPGRLADHLDQHHFYLHGLELLILDEADRMLDLGFAEQLKQIHQAADHRKRQTLMFSATYSNKVKSLANQLLTTPKTLGVAKQNSTSGKIKQSVYWVSEARKRELLSELIGVNNWQQVLVFAGTKESANILAKELKLDGIKAALCHGDKTQGARNKALSDFSEGKVRVLVATDVAARGLDIENLAYVVNFHLPFLAEDYVHRVGRTGRAGKSGTAISLVSPKDERFLGNIEELIGRQFERIIVPGYELKKDEALEYQQSSEKRASKNRYRTNQEKNQVIEKKKQATRSSNTKYNAKIKKKR